MYSNKVKNILLNKSKIKNHSINYSNANKALFKNSPNNSAINDEFVAPTTSNYNGDFESFIPAI